MRIKRLLCAFAIALLMASCCAGALAGVPSSSKEFYFLDQANVLSEATEGEIYFSNQLLYDACGAQIVVAAVNSTNGEAMDDYAYEMFNSWGIGDKKTQNGFLLVLSIKDDDYYAVCGDNLQPKLTSGSLKDYFDRYLEADFAAKRYDAGVKKFFEAIFKRIADTYNADVTTEQGIEAYREWASQSNAAPMNARSGGAMMSRGAAESDDSTLVTGVIFVIILIAVLMMVSRRRRYRRQQVILNAVPPPPPPEAGAGGYRGVGAGGYRGPEPLPRRQSGFGTGWLMRGIFDSMMRSSGGGFRSSGGSRSSRSSGGGFRSSGGGSRSFGGGHGGGGHSSGGGAGRGRH